LIYLDTDDEEIAYNEQLWAVLLLHQKQAGEILIGAVLAVAQAIVLATQKDEAIPYHTSILSGEGWVKELLNGHPERIRMELGTHRFIFDILVAELQAAGYTHSKHVKIEEQLAIFLYICVTGLTIRHVAERFQRSNDTISKYVFSSDSMISTDICHGRYFKKILHAFSSPPIYGKYV
jgi:DNA-binding NarL/FixJ family response regulator